MHIEYFERGSRGAKYLFLMEFEDAAARDRWFPVAGGEHVPEVEDSISRMVSERGTFLATAPGTERAWTDYVEVAP